MVGGTGTRKGHTIELDNGKLVMEGARGLGDSGLEEGRGRSRERRVGDTGQEDSNSDNASRNRHTVRDQGSQGEHAGTMMSGARRPESFDCYRSEIPRKVKCAKWVE